MAKGVGIFRLISLHPLDRIKENREAFMKRRFKLVLLAVLIIAMCQGVFFFVWTDAQAQQKKATALEGTKFDTGISLADNLKIYAGKDVFVHLRSGKTIQGYVKSVGNDFLHLEKLAGRDFYDALIRMDDIGAIEVKFRDMK